MCVCVQVWWCGRSTRRVGLRLKTTPTWMWLITSPEESGCTDRTAPRSRSTPSCTAAGTRYSPNRSFIHSFSVFVSAIKYQAYNRNLPKPTFPTLTKNSHLKVHLLGASEAFRHIFAFTEQLIVKRQTGNEGQERDRYHMQQGSSTWMEPNFGHVQKIPKFKKNKIHQIKLRAQTETFSMLMVS